MGATFRLLVRLTIFDLTHFCLQEFAFYRLGRNHCFPFLPEDHLERMDRKSVSRLAQSSKTKVGLFKALTIRPL